MTPTARYRAFLSYSHRDKAWADWLHKALETYRLPAALVGRETPLGPIPARLAPVFRDRDELAAATDLSHEINDALAGSLFLVVVCSPAAAASRWVNEEIIAFKRVHGDARVRAIIVDGEPFSGDPATECFPQALRHRFNAAGEMTTEPAEPIAADARPQGDGKKFALSKLVAGLTGARLDELIQREQQRRNARLATLAAGLAALVLVLSALTWDALRQRNAARLAQAEAQAQRAQAEFQRDEAQSLVEFMLTDLRQRLDAVGRLDVLEAVGTRLSESYAKQDPAQLDADALGRRARVQLLLGEIDNTRGDLDTALAQYQQAAATTGELLRRDPNQAQRIFDHAQSVFWVGQIAWQRGDADVAKTHFTQYHDYARQLVALDPANDDWQMELNYGLSNLGTLAMDQGDFAAAERHFEDALAVARALSQAQPDDAERSMNTGTSLAWLADAVLRQGKFERALELRLEEIAIYEAWLATRAADADVRQLLASARQRLAQVQLAMGRPEDALANAALAASLADGLLAADSDNIERADRASLAHAIAGEAQMHLGAYAQARQSLLRSIAVADDFVARKGGLEDSRGLNSSPARLAMASLLVRTGRATEAASLYAQVLASHREDMAAGKTVYAVSRRRYCEALAGQARLMPGKGDAWQEIVARLGPAQATLSPEESALLAEAHAHGGRIEQAAALTTPLYASGYRHPDFMALLERFPALRQAAR
jgi:tetratricopeptide (TPR) repeat protein